MFGVFSRSAEDIGASFNRPNCLVRADGERSDNLTVRRLDSGTRLELGRLVTVELPTATSVSLRQHSPAHRHTHTTQMRV